MASCTVHTARFATIDALAVDSSGLQGKVGALALKPCRSRVSICPKHLVPLCYIGMKETFAGFVVPDRCSSSSQAMQQCSDAAHQQGRRTRSRQSESAIQVAHSSEGAAQPCSSAARRHEDQSVSGRGDSEAMQQECDARQRRRGFREARTGHTLSLVNRTWEYGIREQDPRIFYSSAVCKGWEVQPLSFNEGSSWKFYSPSSLPTIPPHHPSSTSLRPSLPTIPPLCV